jgi:uncharacterized protein (DUF488 family)
VLQRQKLILSIINHYDNEISRIILVKLAFLVGQESTIKNNFPFYDFVPYKFGPFSFSLYKELTALENNGYITCTDRSVRANAALSREIKDTINELDWKLIDSADRVLEKYGNWNQDKLIQYVYEKFPWYAISSDLKSKLPKNLPARPIAKKAIYTIGYEGLSIDKFFNLLIQNGIQAIIDVRANPISRKYGFAKKSLEEIAKKLGLTYYHLPKLGIDSSYRRNLNDYDSYQELFNLYETSILPKQKAELKKLTHLLKQCPSTLLCYERSANYCHRGRLAMKASKNSDLEVIHMQN